MAHNEMSGDAGAVVQAGTITGDVHVHSAATGLDPQAAGAARPIGEWNPFDLDVHRAITTPSHSQLPELPGYLRREHDDELARHLQDPQRSVMVVLTGRSSTGKTRALYEAVLNHEVLSTWPLLYARTSDNLLRFVQHDRLKPHTVLWLNETQNHLAGPSGEAVAAWLRTLLDGSVPGPIVVLGTLWPQYWADLADDHPHTRALLQHSVRRIRVAEQFTTDQVCELRTDQAADPRLATAAATSGANRYVIQTLAGGPALVERYEHPDRAEDRYATAIVSAAIDARRLGHRSLLPEALLADAAHGYLADDDRTDPPADWFAQGMAQAAKDPVHGITALVPRRTQPGVGRPDGYELHDYLDQHGQATRSLTPAPASLWDAIASHPLNTADFVQVVFSAYQRLLYPYGNQLLSRSTTSSVPRFDRIRMVALLATYGRLEDALAMTTGEGRRFLSGSMTAVARALVAERRADEALQLYLDICEDAGSHLRGDMVDLFVLHGAIDEALQLLRYLAQQDEQEAGLVRRLTDRGVIPAKKLAQLLMEHHRAGELRQRAEAGDMYAAQSLASLLAEEGQWEEALHWVRGGSWWSTDWVAGQLAKAGRADRLRELAVSGSAVAKVLLIEVLLDNGKVAEAVELYQARVAETGDYLPSERLVELLVAHGEADLITSTIMKHALAEDSTLRFPHLIRCLRACGQEERAVVLLRELADPKNEEARSVHSAAQEELAEVLASRNEWAEVLHLVRTGGSWTLTWFPCKLRELGKLDHLRRLADTGNQEAQLQIADALLDSGQPAEALALLRRFADTRRRNVNDNKVSQRLADLLAERKQFAELRSRAVRGDLACSRKVVELARRGAIPQAKQLLAYGLAVDGSVLQG